MQPSNRKFLRLTLKELVQRLKISMTHTANHCTTVTYCAEQQYKHILFKQVLCYVQFSLKKLLHFYCFAIPLTLRKTSGT